MAHGVMIPSKVAAKNIDSFVRSFKSTVDLDNGNIVLFGSGVSATAGEGEVWIASTPTAATNTDLWMVGEPEIVLTDSKYKGLDPDPRNFYVKAGDIATAFKINKYDIVRLTADNFSNSRTTETYAIIGTSGAELTWQAASTNAKFKLVEVVNIPLPSGSPGSNRITAYRLEAIAE